VDRPAPDTYPYEWRDSPKDSKSTRSKPSGPTAAPTAPVADALELPSFPWPPPRASALRGIPLGWLIDDSATARLRTLDERLGLALDHLGYAQRAYFRAPGGYALVTRIERIEPDGRPRAGAERWALDESAAGIFSITDYLRALFLARPGYFRVLVFTVTPQPFSTSGPPVTSAEAIVWLQTGFNRLPEEIAEIAVASAPFACTALIYEFERAAESDPAHVLLPGRIEARAHLEQSGLLRELERRDR
jgi:hypothetical protein